MIRIARLFAIMFSFIGVIASSLVIGWFLNGGRIHINLHGSDDSDSIS